MGNEVSSVSAVAALENSKVVERRNRNIKRMDQAVRRKLRGGVQFNMKVVIRGGSKTGKSSLWQRLQGKPLDSEYVATPEIQIANINWSFKNTEEAVKVEVWDVVDVGRKAKDGAASGPGAHPVAGPPPGGVCFGVLDASAVDVYQNAQAVIFMVNPASSQSYDYVVEQLTSEKFPRSLAVLVLVNFRDLASDQQSQHATDDAGGSSATDDKGKAAADPPCDAAGKGSSTAAKPPPATDDKAADSDVTAEDDAVESKTGTVSQSTDDVRKVDATEGAASEDRSSGGEATPGNRDKESAEGKENQERGGGGGGGDRGSGDEKGVADNEVKESNGASETQQTATKAKSAAPWLTAAVVEKRLRQLTGLPAKLHVFDCSMANCFGLKILYSYLNVPFLQLKRANLQQAIRVLEEEAAATDVSLTKLVESLTYSDYTDHLERTKKMKNSSAPAAGTAHARTPAAANSATLGGQAVAKASTPPAVEAESQSRNTKGSAAKKKSAEATRGDKNGATISGGDAKDRKAKRKAKADLKYKETKPPTPPPPAIDEAEEEGESADVEEAIKFLNKRRSNDELDSFFSDDDDEDDNHHGVDDGVRDGNDSSGDEGDRYTHADAESEEEKGGAAKGSDNERNADVNQGADSAQDDDSDDEFYAPQRFGLVASTPTTAPESKESEASEEEPSRSPESAEEPLPDDRSNESPSQDNEAAEVEGDGAKTAPTASTPAAVVESSDEIDSRSSTPPLQSQIEGSAEVPDVAVEEDPSPADGAVDEFVASPEASQDMGDWLGKDDSSEDGEVAPSDLGDGPSASGAISEDEMSEPALDGEAHSNGAVEDDTPDDETVEYIDQHQDAHIEEPPSESLSAAAVPEGTDGSDHDEGSDENGEFERQSTRLRTDSQEKSSAATAVSSAAQAAILAAMKAAEEWEAEPQATEGGSKKEKKKKKKKKDDDTAEKKKKKKKKDKDKGVL